MLDSLLRPAKDRALAPLARALAGTVRPNTISAIAFLLGIAAAVAVVSTHVAAALSLWILNRIFDGVDGAVARIGHTQSDFGGYLDMMFDVLVYSALALSFAAAPDALAAPRLLWSACAAMLAAFYINITSWNYLSVLIEKRRTGELPDSDGGAAPADGAADGTGGEAAGGDGAADGTGTEAAGARPRVTSIEMPAGLMEGSETAAIYAALILFPGFRVTGMLLAGGAALFSAVQRIVCAKRLLKD